MDIVLYHKSCPDGWAAAYICKKKYPKAELVPLNHGLDAIQITLLLAQCRDKDVIMVDYSLRTRELNDALNATAKSFHILDHHKSAREVLDGAEYATFDMERSGAGLAWDYLFGKDSSTWLSESCGHGCTDAGCDPKEHTERPWWVNYTEDQDLWNWKLPRGQEVNAYLMVQPRTLEVWDTITDPDKMEVTAAVRQGIGVRAYVDYYTRSVVPEAQEGVFVYEGTNYRTAVLNIPYAGVSEAGNALVKNGYDVALLWFERGDGQIQFSLRSNRDGRNVDVSAIAKLHGGGGHQNAAGFQTSVAAGRDLIDWVLGRVIYVPPRCV
jgi:uncharacterized protein